MKGMLDAVLYRGAVLPTGETSSKAQLWLLVSQAQDDVAPNKGRAIDHLGFSATDLYAAGAELKEKGIGFDVEPGLLRGHSSGRPFGRGHLSLDKYSFVYGPDEVWIEIVECFEPRHCERMEDDR